jgi:hypothetical protein
MRAARPVPTTLYRDSDRTGTTASYPPSGTQPRAPTSRINPLEEALLVRTPRGSSEPDLAVRDVLGLLAVGDEAGAGAAVRLIAIGRPIPVTTVSADVLDEIELDRCAAVFLAHIDGRTDLSRVLQTCPLSEADCVRTLCELIERRIVALRR